MTDYILKGDDRKQLLIELRALEKKIGKRFPASIKGIYSAEAMEFIRHCSEIHWLLAKYPEKKEASCTHDDLICKQCGTNIIVYKHEDKK